MQTKQDLVDYQAYLIAIGGGLIEFIPAERPHELDRGEWPHMNITLVKLIHRPVHTYLWKRGWGQLFNAQHAAKPDHKIWLEVCSDYLQGKHVRWAALISRNWRRSYAEGTHAIDHISPVDWSVGTHSLHDYVHTSLLYHASKFEQETGKTSWPLIHKLLHAKFIREHAARAAAYRDETCSGCYSILWSNGCIVLYGHVQVAVCHHLMLHVEEALARYPEAFSSDPYDGAYYGSDWPITWYYQPVYKETLPEPGPRDSPLATAVACYLTTPSPERSRLMLSLIPHLPRLRDELMLQAIVQAPKAEIEALLVQFPQGAQQFWKTQVTIEGPFGPLWTFGRRKDHHCEEAAEILRVLLARGEEINSQCYPEGTVLHSVVESHYDDLKTLKSSFRMLLSHGADINAPGSRRNVLEYIWKKSHEEPYGKYRNLSSSLIKTFIQMCATNSVCDPNGLVPNRARMLAVAKTKGPSVEDKRYYFHGACSDTKDETSCHRFVCRPCCHKYTLSQSKILLNICKVYEGERTKSIGETGIK